MFKWQNRRTHGLHKSNAIYESMSQHSPKFYKDGDAPQGNFLNTFDLFSYCIYIAGKQPMDWLQGEEDILKICLFLANPINLCRFFF